MKNTAKLWENLHKHSFNACLKWKYLSGAYNLPDRGELGLALVLKELIIQSRVKLSLNSITATIYWVETAASHSSKCLTYACMCACSIAQPCLTLCNSMDCSLPGPSVHWTSQREYWSGLLFPPPGDLTDTEIKPMSPAAPTLAGGFFTTEPPGSLTYTNTLNVCNGM